MVDDNITRGSKKIGGVTSLGDRVGTGYNSDIYLSKSAFNNKFKLYLTLGHENVHVIHNAFPGLRDTFLVNFRLFSEHAAYGWTKDAVSTMRGAHSALNYGAIQRTYRSNFLFDWTAENIRLSKFLKF